MRKIKNIFLVFTILFGTLFSVTFAYYQNPNVTCPQVFGNLQRGSNGPEVKELQKFLKDYYDLGDDDISVSGYFGRLTQKYLVKFQIERGLQGLGIAGPLTRAQFAIVCGNSTPAPVSGNWDNINLIDSTNVKYVDLNFDGLVDKVVLNVGTYGYHGLPTMSVYVQTTSGNYILSTELTNLINSVGSLKINSVAKTITTIGDIGNNSVATKIYTVIPGVGLNLISTNISYNDVPVVPLPISVPLNPVSQIAFIDQSSVNANNNTFTITGTAPGQNVYVALVPISYNGATDWTTIYNNRSFTASTGDTIAYVTNGKFSVNFTGVPSGSYFALIYGNNQSYGSQPLLGRSNLYVTNNNYINTTFNVGSTQTLGIGQTVSDGRLTLTLLSVKYSNGNSGVLQATFRYISNYSGYSYTNTATLQDIVADIGELTPGDYTTGHAVRLINASLNMQTATVQFERSQKG